MHVNSSSAYYILYMVLDRMLKFSNTNVDKANIIDLSYNVHYSCRALPALTNRTLWLGEAIQMPAQVRNL